MSGHHFRANDIPHCFYSVTRYTELQELITMHHPLIDNILSSLSIPSPQCAADQEVVGLEHSP